MPRYLTLSRAARLVGVRRGALQSKIRTGELAAFEGMVSEEDLMRAYPEARLEDNTVLERLEAIKEAAFARRPRTGSRNWRDARQRWRGVRSPRCP